MPGSTQTETFFQNVGGVWAHGAELSGQWKPDLFDGKLYFNANVSYNISKFQDNFADLRHQGEQRPGLPEVAGAGRA